MRRLKKSTVCLLLGAFLFASSMTVYAASYDFYEILTLPIEEKLLSTRPRQSTLIDSAIMTLEYSNCPQGYTLYTIRDATTSAEVTNSLYLSNQYTYKDAEGNDVVGITRSLKYLNAYKTKKMTARLYATASGGNTGYTVSGVWNPDGSYT